MMLTDNITFLKSQFPHVWTIIDACDGQDEHIKVELAKNSLHTIAVQVGSRWNYLHSSYDPHAEATRFIEQVKKDLGHHKHVFFYGVGLGYHIEEFMKNFPTSSFSIYEPNVSIFKNLLSFTSLQNWKKYLKNIYVGDAPEAVLRNLKHFTYNIKEESGIIVLPSYERVFRDETNSFIEKFREAVFVSRSYIRQSKIFSKRLSINNIINLSKVVESPDILTDGKDVFRGKPAVLVAAGPSLDLEYENLRYIKENGIAHIFSVGSAVNSLIKQGIYPDAACTYDGSVKNATVFELIAKQGIKDIPLFFGTTVGFETLQNYPGQLFHFFLTRDTISPYFLRRENGENIDMVGSYQTIATVTLHLLYKLGCNPIILVGQNFAFTETQTYAKGIDYIQPELSEEKIRDTIKIKDVYGNEVLTSRTFDMMRQEMQDLIRTMDESVEIVNTTQGGAHIEGTKFVPMQQLIHEKLVKKDSVSYEFLKMDNAQYDLEYFSNQVKRMQTIIEQYENVVQKFEELFSEMNHYVVSRNQKQLDKCFNKFDKLFNRLQKNEFNARVIFPMNGLMFVEIMKMFEDVRFSKDVVAKANRVMKDFTKYLEDCRTDTKVIKHLLEEMQQEVLGEIVTV